MSWASPWMLLTLVIPLLSYTVLRRLAASGTHANRTALLRVEVNGGRVSAAAARPVTVVVLFGAVALMVVALARPQWGDSGATRLSQSREVILALDLSQSMLTEDVPPSRLERARSIATQLLDELHGESVGLVVFAGTAFVQVPLSPDYQIIREFLPTLDAGYLPQGGSNYAGMLQAALDGFSSADDRDRYLVILSDGESSTTAWQSHLDELAERNVHVLGVGMGTHEGGFIADPLVGGYRAGANGQPIHSRLMPSTLQTLASRTAGHYVDGVEVAEPAAVRAVLTATVEQGRRGRVEGAAGGDLEDRFQWFLLPAVLLGFYSLLREFPRRARASVRTHGAPLRQRPSTAPAAVAAVVLAGLAAVLIAPGAIGHFDDDAGFEVRASFDSDPAERVRAIAAHLAEYDYDAFDLRLLVEESIRYGVDRQRTGEPIEAGVVRDALAAAAQGAEIDDGIADWTYYRAQLEKLLEVDAGTEEAPSGSDDRRQLMDEEDSQPLVAGQSTQQSANDSFGQGASGRSDTALGDLSSDREVTIPGRRKPPPAGARAGASGPPQADAVAHDPILAFSLERLEEVVRRDSPGRLHQLMVGDESQQNINEFDW